jgi:hypothetical protein
MMEKLFAFDRPGELDYFRIDRAKDGTVVIEMSGEEYKMSPEEFEKLRTALGSERKITLDLASAVAALEENPELGHRINTAVLGKVAADELKLCQDTNKELTARVSDLKEQVEHSRQW